MNWHWTWQDPVVLCLAALITVSALSWRRAKGVGGCRECPAERRE